MNVEHKLRKVESGKTTSIFIDVMVDGEQYFSNLLVVGPSQRIAHLDPATTSIEGYQEVMGFSQKRTIDG